MSDIFEIQSHKGPYQVLFSDKLSIDKETISKSHFIVDQKVADLCRDMLGDILTAPSLLIIEAVENNKSLEKFPAYVEQLINHKIQRNHKLIAIGGGIIQDITCFLAANLLRGLEWWYFPTTLLAQADSCIGSKSSINCNNIKNILGTFTPPKKVQINLDFLATLSQNDLRSGVGEMIKVHAIAGEELFYSIQQDYTNLFNDSKILAHYIKQSLAIKKNIIEMDEFDLGARNIMNYGHTFGHAIESATDFTIPHGIAVTIGMDMANYIAMHGGVTTEYHYKRMHSVLKTNYVDYQDCTIPLAPFLQAIARDKKNIGINKIGLILPDKNGIPTKVLYDNNQMFHDFCEIYLNHGRSL